jgi:hypothetical protein
MARPEWRDAGKERLWRKLVRDWERSELTIREFCVRRGLEEHNFHAWRRTLSARAQERTAPAFLPVEVVAEAAAPIEIIFPDGVVVRVRAGVDEATLRQVLAALAKELSC